MIRWFANNNIAANFLMVGILLAGLYVALNKIPLEVQPARVYDNIRVTMDYRGGTARDVEQSVIIPIEQALEGLEESMPSPPELAGATPGCGSTSIPTPRSARSWKR